MTRALAGRWVLLAAISFLAAVLALALVKAGPVRAGPPPDTAAISQLTGPPSQNTMVLRATASLTDTYAAILAAETLLDPSLTATYLPLITR